MSRRARLVLGPDLLSHLLYFGTVVLVLVLDQVTKMWVVTNLTPYRPTDLLSWLSPVLSMTFVRNTGVAFGLFPSLGRAFMWLSLAVVVSIFVYRRTIPGTDLWVHLSLGLVTGGALGNVIDRALRGYVVDFLDVNFRPMTDWPLFNLADSAVVAGVAVLLVDAFIVERKAAPANV